MAEIQISGDLNVMVPVVNTILIGDKNVTVGTMKVKQLSQVMKAVQPFIGAFTKKDGAPQMPDIPSLLIDNTGNVVTVVAILTGESEDWVNDLDLAQLIDLFTKIVEVNVSFFTLKVAPAIQQAMGHLGKTQSPPSLSTGSKTGPTPSKP